MLQYFVGLQELRKSRMKPGKEPHATRGLVTLVLCYRLMVNSMKTSFAQQSIVASPFSNHIN